MIIRLIYLSRVLPLGTLLIKSMHRIKNKRIKYREKRVTIGNVIDVILNMTFRIVIHHNNGSFTLKEYFRWI